MATIDADFPRFPNLQLLQQQASTSTVFEDSDTLKYSSEFLETRVQRDSILQKYYAEVCRLERKSILNVVNVAQLTLLRSDYQQVIIQNTTPQLHQTLVPVINFVADLCRAFKPEIYRPFQSRIPPLVKWASGSAAKRGPYTITSQDIQILSIPGRFYKGGIIGWTLIAHQIGHALLESWSLIEVLPSSVEQALPKKTDREKFLKEYFLSKVSEVAADIIGLSLLGPAAGVGLIADLRLNREGHLSCTDLKSKDRHYVDMSRPYWVGYAMHVLFPKRMSAEGKPLSTDWNEYCNEMMAEMVKDLHKTLEFGSKRERQIQKHANEVALYCRQTVDTLIARLSLAVQLHKWKWGPKDEAIVDSVSAPRDSRHVVAAAFFKSAQREQEAIEYEGIFAPSKREENEKIEKVFAEMMARLSSIKKESRG